MCGVDTPRFSSLYLNPRIVGEKTTKDVSRLKQVEGIVEEALPGLLFRVKIASEGGSVLAHLGGKLRLHHIRVIPGDRVVVEMTPYDDARGRIVRRL